MIKLSYSARTTGWHLSPINNPAEEYRYLARRPDLAFWLRCCKAYAQRGQPILYLCCGMGMVAMAIADEGYSVVGVDVNQQFIVWAQESDRSVRQPALPPNAGSVEFVVQDVVTLDLKRIFPLVIMVNSFDYLITEEDQSSCLARVHDHLTEGGKFIFDVFEAGLCPDGTIGPKNLADFKTRHKRGDDPHVWRNRRTGRIIERFSTREELEALVTPAHLKIVTCEEIYRRGDNPAVAVITELLQS